MKIKEESQEQEKMCLPSFRRTMAQRRGELQVTYSWVSALYLTPGAWITQVELLETLSQSLFLSAVKNDAACQ